MKPHDPWALTGAPEPYSIDKFYTEHKDHQGHSGRIQLRINEGLQAEIQSLINKGVLPDYNSFHDFLRDACHHRMEYLRTLVHDPQFDRYVEAARRRAVFDRIAREMEEQFNEVQQLKDQFRMASERGDKQGLSDLLDYCEDQLDTFRSPYKEQIEQTMESYKPQVK